MKQEVKDKWAAALRSGKYIQGRGKLKAEYQRITEHTTEIQHCCLGVLCELAVEDGVPLSCHVTNERVYGFDLNTTHLPRLVQEWAGLSSENPLIEVHREDSQLDVASLSNRNDRGEKFSEIATLIEKYL